MSLSKMPVLALIEGITLYLNMEHIWTRKIISLLNPSLKNRALSFSDVENFVINKVVNSRIDRHCHLHQSGEAVVHWGAPAPPEGIHVGHSHVFWTTTCAGPWYPGTIDQVKYKNYLVHKVFSAFNTMYGQSRYIWVHDGNPVHTSNIIQKKLRNRRRFI